MGYKKHKVHVAHWYRVKVHLAMEHGAMPWSIKTGLKVLEEAGQKGDFAGAKI